jgi:DNA-binding response OmpR family regulator
VPVVLLASDTAAVRSELLTTLEGPDVTMQTVTSGEAVRAAVAAGGVDLVIVDLQIGTMGGMAVTMDLRHEESYGAIGHVPVLMLLDRRADVFLARRSGAEGFVVRPLNPLTVRRAVRALLRGDTFEDDALTPATIRVPASLGE